MNKFGIGEVFTPIRASVVIIAETFDVFAEADASALSLVAPLPLGRNIGEWASRNVQRPDVRNDIAPRCDFNLDAKTRQQA